MSRDIKIEAKAMIWGILANLIMGIAGWYMYSITNIDAWFLDGSFSAISALSCLMAIFISRYSNKKTERFPDGLNFLEPLYGVFKAVLSIGLLVVAVESAIRKLYLYFRYEEGTILVTGPALVYSIIMVGLCFGLAWAFMYYNKKIGNKSTILQVESKASIIDGIISIGVGFAIILIDFIPKTEYFLFVHYTADAIVTLLLIAATYKGIILACKDSFVELVWGVSTSKQIVNRVKMEVNKIAQENMKIYLKEIKVYKVGKKIATTVSIDTNRSNCNIEDLASFKQRILKKLHVQYSQVDVELLV